jgi:hypothetical protein
MHDVSSAGQASISSLLGPTFPLGQCDPALLLNSLPDLLHILHSSPPSTKSYPDTKYLPLYTMQYSLSKEGIRPSIQSIVEFGIKQIQFGVALASFTFKAEDD